MFRSVAAVLIVVWAVAGQAAAARLKAVGAGFEAPVFAASPSGDNRLFVVEQAGRIRILDPDTGQTNAIPFLEISDVLTSGEQGLLGLAFSPDFATSGVFYVNFTRRPDGATVIRRYTSAGGVIAHAGSGVDVLVISQPFSNHNAGWIGFGPDGYLYVPTGDGGGGNDPGNRAQDLSSLLGKVLRISVSSSSPGYSIPADNPFAGGGGAPEVWDYGLRNPFRCSFDRRNGDFWIADVGQNAREEIDRHPARRGGGMNFGWRVFEGKIRTPGIDDPNPGNATRPVHDYPREDGQSVIGGYVVRDPGAGDLRGRYVFGDFVSGRIWTFQPRGNKARQFQEITDDLGGPVNSLASFAEDGAGRLFVVSRAGRVFRLFGSSGTRPEVAVSGADRRTVRTASVRIRGRVRGGGEVRRVICRSGGLRQVSKRSRSWTFRVALRFGENRIALKAVDAQGRKSPGKVLLVTRE